MTDEYKTIFELNKDRNTCIFKDKEYQIQYDENSKEKFITIERNKYKFIENETQFKNLLDNTESLSFSYYIFLISLDFTSCRFKCYLSFKNSIFTKLVTFERATFEKITCFVDSIFIGMANFRNSKFLAGSLFEKTIFYFNAIFYEATFNYYVSFKKVIYNEFTNFGNVKFNSFTNFEKAIFKGSTSFENVIFNESSDFNQTLFKDTARFHGAIFNEDVDFIYAKFNKRLDFNNSVITKKFNFEWGEVELLLFDNIVMKPTCTINFKNLSVEFFTYSNTNFIDAANSETFLFIKNYSLNNNDQKNALIYYKKEMDKYREEANKTGKSSDMFILTFEKFVSEYGTNPFKPIMIMLGICFAFTLFLMMFLPNVNFLSTTILLLNPTSSIEKLNIAEDIPPFLEALNFIKNIFIGILIYEIIKSFRKFSRKL